MKLNSNIPSFKAFVKKSFFTKEESHNNEYYNVYVFGIQSLAGKIKKKMIGTIVQKVLFLLNPIFLANKIKHK